MKIQFLLTTLFILTFTITSHAEKAVKFCNATSPDTCKFLANTSERSSNSRPSSTYTFTDEVPFKKCYSKGTAEYENCFKNESLLRQPFILGPKNLVDSVENQVVVANNKLNKNKKRMIASEDEAGPEEEVTPEADQAQMADVAILMIHGLSDGPYYNKPMGTFLHEKFNVPVVAIRLSGHGSTASDLGLDKVILDSDQKEHHQWYDDVDYGYEIAKRLGKKVIVTGFSLGGILATRLYKVKKEAGDTTISGLLLFSPALSLPSTIQVGSCIASDIARQNDKVFTSDSLFGGGGEKIRYMQMSYAGACHISQIVGKTDISAYAKKFTVPTYSLLTTADKAIDRKNLEDFMSNISGPKKLFVINKDTLNPLSNEFFWAHIYTKTNNFVEVHSVKEGLDHSWVMLGENESSISQQINPLFKETAQSVCSFVKDNMNVPLRASNCN